MKLNINNIIIFILTLLIILSINSIYYNIYTVFFKNTILIVSIIFLFYQITHNKNGRNIFLNSFIKLVLILLFMVIFIAISGYNYDFIYLFFILFPILFFAFSLASKETMNNFFVIFSNITVLLSILSLIFYFAFSVFKISTPTNYVSIVWGTEHYINSFFNLYFETQVQYFNGYAFCRNTGIFTEAPMYSLVLSLALGFEILINKNIRNRKNSFIIIILILTIISTFSVTGIISMFIILFLNYILYNKDNKKVKTFKLFFVPVLFFALLFILNNIFQSKMNTASYRVRIDDYVSGYKAWMDSPIFGNGINSINTLKYANFSERTSNGVANSLIMVLSKGGVYLLAFYIIPLIITIKAKCKTNKKELILCILIVFLFSSTIFHFSPLIITLLAIGYANSNVKFKEGVKI